MPLGPFNITCVATIPGEGEDDAPVWVEFRTKDTPPTKRDAEWQKKLSKPLKAKGRVAELIRFIKRLNPNDELQFNVIQDAWNKMIVANLQQTHEE